MTHQLQFIKSVDQIVIMDKGKIIGNGAFDDLDVNIHNTKKFNRITGESDILPKY